MSLIKSGYFIAFLVVAIAYAVLFVYSKKLTDVASLLGIDNKNKQIAYFGIFTVLAVSLMYMHYSDFIGMNDEYI